MNVRDLIERADIHPKLTDAIILMISSRYLPYYGEFSQYINFFKAKIRTCGVNVTEKGACFYWNEEWVDKLTPDETVFVVIHEVMHLLFDHIKRGVGYDKDISNLAMDMIINSIIHGDLITYEKLSYIIDIPKDEKQHNKCIFLDKRYTGKPIFEELYTWVMEQYVKWRSENAEKIEKLKKKTINISKDGIGRIEDWLDEGEDDGYGPNGKSGDDDQNSVDMYPLERFFENKEFGNGLEFDFHFDDDVCEEVRKQWSNGIMEQLKARGLDTNNVLKVLGKLIKSEIDYLKEIKRIVSNDIFGNKKKRIITRPNRRDIPGLKGNKKYISKINCILDTSGSMEGLFERVLSYIYDHDVFMNLIQCDSEVKNFVLVKNKRDLEKMNIEGLGGTVISSGLQYIAHDKHLNKYATVVLTDGYTDSLNFTGVKNNVLILSCGEHCPIIAESYSKNIKISQIILPKNK